MPRTKSHIKNQKITLRNRNNNRKYKLDVKKAIKHYLLCIRANSDIDSDKKTLMYKDTLSLVYQKIDKAVNKNVFHKNTAARKKSKLALLIK
uniref:Ribosomal protein S20 n=1 Tax=Polysiphonia sertularioides TaxID=945028 RepID=A0A1Z1MG75_9FLOR|nr:ribosomal protein S20 [Polysiphonia sertularioides]